MLLLSGLGSISSSGHLPSAEIGVPPAPGGAGEAGFPPCQGLLTRGMQQVKRQHDFFPAS